MTSPTDDEPGDEFELHRRATELLFTMLGPDFVVHGPAEDIRDAMRRLATPGAVSPEALAYFQAVCHWESDEFEQLDRTAPIEVEDAWLDAAASIVAPYEAEDIENHPATALGHVEWLTIAVAVHRAGAGTVVNVEWLTDQLEIEDSAAPEFRADVEAACATVCRLWRALGVIDAEDRLTELGGWGVPIALLDAWETPPVEDDGDGDDDFAANLEAAAAVEFVKRQWDDDPTAIDGPEWAAAASLVWTRGDALSLTVAQPGWAGFLDEMYAAVSGTEPAAGPALLRAIRAEYDGDVAAAQEWVDTSIAADPTHPDSLLLGAELAGAAGDAQSARDLLRRAEVDADDGDLAVYERFSRRPDGGPSRNAPCSCGSGLKYKLCHGARVGHPLEARANWIWLKAMQFLHRPLNHLELMQWAALRCGVDERGADPEVIGAALVDPLVLDCALFDGALIDGFLELRGPLLPADERAVVQSWRSTHRGAYDVLDARPGISVTVRDVGDDATVEVRERQASYELQRGDLLLTRILPVGDIATFGFVTTVPRLKRSSLADLLARTQDAEPLMRWLDQASKPPDLQTTEGEELLQVTQQWKVAADGWAQLAETLSVDGPDELSEWYDDKHGTPWLRGKLERTGDQVTLTTYSAPRADRLADMLTRAGGSLVSEKRETMADAIRRPHLVSDPPETTPEMAAALDEYVRAHERRWVDEEIPMFKGRTPRQMVRSAAGRREVTAFLDDIRAQNARSGGGAPGAMDPDRISELLGLPSHVDG